MMSIHVPSLRGGAMLRIPERDEIEANAVKLVDHAQRSYEQILQAARDTVPAPEELFAPWGDIEVSLATATGNVYGVSWKIP